jgi:Uma2 family endonuclease
MENYDMSATLDISVPEPVVVHFEPSKLRMNDEEFFQFCQLNPELRIERTSGGDIIVMAPTGGKTGRRNAKLIVAFGRWAEEDGRGQFFDSSTEFILPNGAGRAPDLSWIRNERWLALTEKQQEQFPPLCPDFVVELRSPTDRLETLRTKMEEYVANGAELGWLIDPLERTVNIFRPGLDPEVLENPHQVSGEPLLKGFVLDVQVLWD